MTRNGHDDKALQRSNGELLRRTLIKLRTMYLLQLIAGLIVLTGPATILAADTKVGHQPDKIIALVGAQGCGTKGVRERVEHLGTVLAQDSNTKRVVLNLPIDPANNRDVLGNQSAFLAVLAMVAPMAAQPRLMEKIIKAFEPTTCRLDLYQVKERRWREYPKTWPMGTSTPGVKMIMAVTRLPELSHDEFADMWAEHANVALANPVKTLQYIQNVVVAKSAGARDFDGIAEMHFHSMDEFRTRAKVAPEATQRGARDGMRFTSLDAVASLLAEEKIVKSDE